MKVGDLQTTTKAGKVEASATRARSQRRPSHEGSVVCDYGTFSHPIVFGGSQ